MSTITAELSAVVQERLRRAALLHLMHGFEVEKHAAVLDDHGDAEAERAIRANIAWVVGVGDLFDQLGYQPEPRPMTITADSELLSDLARGGLEMIDDEIRGDIVADRTPHSTSAMQHFAECTAGLEALVVDAGEGLLAVGPRT